MNLDKLKNRKFVAAAVAIICFVVAAALGLEVDDKTQGAITDTTCALIDCDAPGAVTTVNP